MFLAKLVLEALIKDIELENPFHGGKVFVRFVWENLHEELANYAASLLDRQQLLHRIHLLQEKTMRYGMVIRIYNPLSQQEEEEIDRTFAEAVDTLEIVPKNNNTIERIIFGVDSRYSSE